MEKLALTIPEVCEATGSGRTAVYAAIARGDLLARKLGRRTIILREDLDGWLSRLPKREVRQ